MVGRSESALNQFKEIPENQKAIYYYCASNEKKIGLCKASTVRKIYNMIGVLQSRNFFFQSSAQSQRDFEAAIAEIPTRNLEHEVKPLCDILWL